MRRKLDKVENSTKLKPCSATTLDEATSWTEWAWNNKTLKGNDSASYASGQCCLNEFTIAEVLSIIGPNLITFCHYLAR